MMKGKVKVWGGSEGDRGEGQEVTDVGQLER